MEYANQFFFRCAISALICSMLAVSPRLESAETRVVIRDNPIGYQQTLDDRFDFTFDLGRGFRRGSLDWSIADSAGPNILSELTYKNVHYDELTGVVGIYIKEGYLEGLSATARYRRGKAAKGTIQDSDYRGDNRTREYSRDISSAKGSRVLSIDLELGYRFLVLDNLYFTPAIGYHMSEQNMQMTKGNAIIGSAPGGGPSGPYEGLDSRYNAEWDGLKVGANLTYGINQHIFGFDAWLLKLNFYAEADWNLRSDFAHPVSFAQWADADGSKMGFFYQYQFSKLLSLKAEYQREEFNSDPGRDVVYFANGRTAETLLNSVNWSSHMYTFSVNFDF